jgi:hypothetical protein
LQVIEKAAGQADTTAFGQGHGHLLFVKMTVFHILLVVIDAADERLVHLLQELVEEDPLHLGADLGQVLALGLRVFGLSLILQSIERGQALGAHGAERQSGHDITFHSPLLR